MRTLASRFNVHVFLINSRPLDAFTNLDDIPPGHEIRYLTRADAAKVSEQADLNLPGVFVEAAFDRGDVCIGYFDGGRLVSYFWCGFDAVPMEEGLWVRVPPDYSYAYKALTLASYRGRHLQHYLTAASDCELIKLGRTHNIEYIATHNFPQRAASARYGNRTVGIAGYVKWRSRLWPFHSRGVRATGFEFFIPRS